VGLARGFSEEHYQGVEEIIREEFEGTCGDVVAEPDLSGSGKESPEERSEYVRRRVKEGQEDDHPQMGVYFCLKIPSSTILIRESS
jgi:hypothetical protein